METIFIVSVGLAIFFISGAIARKEGIPESVSEIAYIFPRPIFSIWMATTAILMAPMLMEKTELMGFLLIAALLGVSVTSAYKERETVWHWGFGGMAALAITCCVAVYSPWLLFAWIPYFVSMVAFTPLSWLFWAEIILYLQIVYIIS